MALACLWIAALPGLAGAEGRFDLGSAPSEGISEVADSVGYTVSIEGEMDDEVRDLIVRVSQLLTLQDKPPATTAALERRVESDEGRFREVLRSRGFYDASVERAIDADARPAAVRFTIDQGPVYVLAGYEIGYVDGEAPDLVEDISELGLDIGMQARSEAILDAQSRVTALLAARGYPFATIEGQKAVVNHDDHTMTVTLSVRHGERVEFGPAVVSGAEEVEEDYIHEFLAWEQGEVYDQDKVAAAKSELMATGLFSAVEITHPDKPEPPGSLPVEVKVAEAPHRSIGLGLGFSSAEGPSGQVFWEHRNLFGRNEQLKLSLEGSFLSRAAEADFRKPRFLNPRQALVANANVAQNNTEAFNEETGRLSVGLDRRFLQNWSGTLATSFEFSQIEEDGKETGFALFGLPLTLARDDTDSVLNPTTGTRLSFNMTPYHGISDSPVDFLSASIVGSTYYPAIGKDDLVLAARARVGSILGPATEDVPASKRFYAGGGGSIRGYEYQRVGPLDSNLRPAGGSSLVEMAFEARFRVYDDFGIVPFVDGGTAYDSPLPDGEQELRWAGGLGLRYYTSIGPIRLDVAMPINRREGVDDRYQFYISLGQAF